MNKFAVACTLAVAASAQEIRIEGDVQKVAEKVNGYVEEHQELHDAKLDAVLDWAAELEDNVAEYLVETEDNVDYVVETLEMIASDYKEDPE